MEVLKPIMNVCASTFDMGSDLINSLDFLGYNATTSISSTVLGSSNISNGYEVHHIWGIVGISIMFMPGLAFLPFVVMLKFDEKNWKFGLYVLFLPIMPLLQVLIHCYSTWSACKDGKLDSDGKQVLMFNIGIEAFWESFPQMVLQGYTIFTIIKSPISK